MRLFARLRTLALASLVGCGAATPAPALLPGDSSPSATDSLSGAPTTYGGGPKHPLASDVSTIGARETFEKSLNPELGGHLRADGWLDIGARVAVSAEFGPEKTPSRSTLRWMLWRTGNAGVYDMGYANTWVQTRGSDVASDLDGDVERFARHISPRPVERAYGIARFASGSSSTSQAILVAALPVEVLPFAKSWDLGSEVTITIKDLRGHVAPLLYADLGNEVKRLLMTVRGATASISFKAPTTPSRVMIEVRAEESGPRGRSQVTVLHAPLWVGMPEATSARQLLGPPAPNPDNPTAMSQAIRAAYAAERRRAGVGDFASDPRLAERANAWAQRLGQGAGAPITSNDLRDAGFATRFSVHQEHLKTSDFGDYTATQLLSPYMKSLLLERDATLEVAVVPIGSDGVRVAIVEALIWSSLPTKPGAPP